MTTEFKMPEPIGDVVGSVDIDGDFYYRMRPTKNWPKSGTNLYTESQLKQAMRDVLEEAAKECLLAAGGLRQYSSVTPDSMAERCVDKIRKLLEQVK